MPFKALLRCIYAKDILSVFISRTTEGLNRKGAGTCSKGPQGGIEPGVTKERTQVLYMGRLLYHGATRAPLDAIILCVLIINFLHLHIQ